MAVFQEDGTVIAKQSAANALHTPRPGWSEYDPQEVWELDRRLPANLPGLC